MNEILAFFHQFIIHTYGVFTAPENVNLILRFMPFILFLEFPYYLLILIGVALYFIKNEGQLQDYQNKYYPTISVVITCYAEGEAVRESILSIAEQVYPGFIEIFIMIDGIEPKTEPTYEAAMRLRAYVHRLPQRKLVIIRKKQRGGRVSSNNLASDLVHGEIMLTMDGDTSCDNTTLSNMAILFMNSNVIACTGPIRVRNYKKNLLTRMQALEYIMSIYISRLGLSMFNTINTLSGAFACYRRSFVQKIGGWFTGAAEDTDITLRIQSYFGRYKKLRVMFALGAVAHTDAPETIRGLFKQRRRWDGDLFFIYIRRHWRNFRPRYMGWTNFLVVLFSGFYFQILVPFLLFTYLVYLFVKFNLVTALLLISLAYYFYFFILVVFYLVFIVFISERKREDLKLAWLILFFPIYSFFIRIVGIVAVLGEAFGKTHLDTSMAPWWVLRKNKF